MTAALLYGAQARVSGELGAIKPAQNALTPLALLLALALWSRLERRGWARGLTRFLARHAMGFYYVHVFVLELVGNRPFFWQGLPVLLLLLPLVFVLSLALAVILDALAALPGRLFRRWRRI